MEEKYLLKNNKMKNQLTDFKFDYEGKESTARQFIFMICVISFFFCITTIFAQTPDHMQNLISGLEENHFSIDVPKNNKLVFYGGFDPIHTERFIAKYETYEAYPRLDSNGKDYIIGYGFKARGRTYMTKKQADYILTLEVIRLKKMIDMSFEREFTANQYTALISLIYNLGGRSPDTMPKFKELVEHNKGKKEWENWFSYSQGVYLRGLNKRRKEETNLFYN